MRTREVGCLKDGLWRDSSRALELYLHSPDDVQKRIAYRGVSADKILDELLGRPDSRRPVGRVPSRILRRADVPVAS